MAITPTVQPPGKNRDNIPVPGAQIEGETDHGATRPQILLRDVHRQVLQGRGANQ